MIHESADSRPAQLIGDEFQRVAGILDAFAAEEAQTAAQQGPPTYSIESPERTAFVADLVVRAQLLTDHVFTTPTGGGGLRYVLNEHHEAPGREPTVVTLDMEHLPAVQKVARRPLAGSLVLSGEPVTGEDRLDPAGEAIRFLSPRTAGGSNRMEQLRDSAGRAAFIGLIEARASDNDGLSLAGQVSLLMYRLAQQAAAGESAQPWQYIGTAFSMSTIGRILRDYRPKRRDRALREEAIGFYDAIAAQASEAGEHIPVGLARIQDSDRHLTESATMLAGVLQGSGLESPFYREFITLKQTEHATHSVHS